MKMPAADDVAQMDALVKEFLELVGQLINQRRVELGKSQLEVAKIAGFSRTEMHNIERGHTDEKLGTLFRVCHALQMSFGAAILHALYLMDHPEFRAPAGTLKNLRGKRSGRSLH